ncbi:MAG: hypothetical protein ABI461_15320 [Polyangiaceae bacterium]
MRIVAAFFFGLVMCACNRVETKTAVVQDSGGPPCSVLPTFDCDPVAESSSSCTWEGGVTASGATLPTDASFPPTCQAYFRGADCSSRGFCTCDPVDDAGAAAFWNCHDVDGGT